MNKLLEFFQEESGKLSSGILLSFIVGVSFTYLMIVVGLANKTIPDFPPGVIVFLSSIYGMRKYAGYKEIEQKKETYNDKG